MHVSAAISLAQVDSKMPPKVKSRQTPEPTTETDSSQPAPAIKTPKPKRGKSSGKGKTVKKEARGKASPAPGTPSRGRPSKESQFLQAVASTSGVHQDVVESVLRAVETVALDTLREKRRFKVSFLQGRLNEKKERLAGEKRVFGKVVAVPARPAKRNVKFSPTKEFRALFA